MAASPPLYPSSRHTGSDAIAATTKLEDVGCARAGVTLRNPLLTRDGSQGGREGRADGSRWKERSKRKRPHSGRVVVRALRSANIVFVVAASIVAAIARVTPRRVDILPFVQSSPSGHYPTLSRYLACPDPLPPWSSYLLAAPRLGFVSVSSRVCRDRVTPVNGVRSLDEICKWR